MVLVKDPEEDVTQLEELMFEEAFPDINSPGYWIAKSEEDTTQAKAIILDGHSTLLIYNQKDEDLPWSAYNELGQYKYQADQIGDGAILVPHTFYFEFTIALSSKKVKVHGNFNGNGISAITLPLKEVSIGDFFSAMAHRISEAMSSELRSIDDQIPMEEKAKFQIPSSVATKLGMKLSLIGLSTEKFTIMESSEINRETGKIIEEVFEEPPTKVKTQLEEEEKERKEARIKKAEAAAKAVKAKGEQKKKSKETIAEAPKTEESVPSPKASPPPGAPSTERIVPPPPGTRGLPTPGGGTSSGPPPTTGGGGGPPSPGSGPPGVPGVPKASPSPSPAPTPQTSNASDAAPPSAPPKAAPSPSNLPSKRARRSESVSKSAVSSSDDDPFAGLDLGEMGGLSEELDEVEDRFLAKGMQKSVPSSTALRHTHATYFERMIPNRAYPILIKITSTETGVRKSVTNVITGEKISEVEETLVIEEDARLTIRPEFPGCLVVPSEHVVEPDQDVEVRFHVTPLATGTLDASVKFMQHGREIHAMLLETKVITHRLARWMTYLGTAASAVPMAFAFLLNEEPASFMEKRLDTMLPALGYLGWVLPGIITGVCLGLSGLLYKLRSPSQSSKSLAFPH